MPEPSAPTREELLATLCATGDEVVARLRAVPPAAYEDGRYENGWNARQILAHVAAIEWTYARLLDVAADATGAPPAAAAGGVRRTAPDEAAGIATRAAQGGIDAYNARQVEKRADATVGELIDEFEANRARTIAAVAAAPEELLGRTIRSAGGITGPLAGVIRAVAIEHVLGHAADIAGTSAAG